MERIFIWGTGKIARQVLEQEDFLELYDVIGFIDNNLAKRGKLFKGKQVFKPDILECIRPDKIVILTDYYEEIKQQIIDMFPDMEMIIENKNYFYRKSICNRYENTDDPEIQEILKHIRKKDLQIFNYDFADKYNELSIDVMFDTNCGMFYIRHQGKKLYFAKFLNTKSKVKEYYRGLLIEQDKASPHRYRGSDFDVRNGEVVVDAGTAEGIFSLEIIDRVSKIYLIESDEGWIEALKETFKEYQEKIVIIQKFITSINEGKSATLDQLIQEPVDFIKMDIEGNEWDALLGAENLIRCSPQLKCAICSYHSDFDEILIKDILGKYGLKCSTTIGYMWFPVKLRKSYIPLKFSRGIVRGIK